MKAVTSKTIGSLEKTKRINEINDKFKQAGAELCQAQTGLH